MIENTFSAIGKRKTSIAKVILKDGSGIIQINEKNFDSFFAGLVEEAQMIKKPLLLANLSEKYDITIFVRGGGISSQLDAIRLALARAVCKISLEYRKILKEKLLLRRDSRIKERRKYGLKKARKASQYSKR
jgi:small subunit ribosomal protein S9